MPRLLFAMICLALAAYPTIAGAKCSGEEQGFVKSRLGEMPVDIVFDNQSSDRLTLYWIDYEGKRQKYATIKPRTTFTQSTFITHPWALARGTNDCYGLFWPDGQTRTIVIESLYDVRTGPLWGDEDAAEVCPGKCSEWEARWTGEWRNVIPAVRSACQCVGGKG